MSNSSFFLEMIELCRVFKNNISKMMTLYNEKSIIIIVKYINFSYLFGNIL